MWVIAFAFSGGASISLQPRELTEEDAGRALTVKVGDTLALKLRNPASGGYDQVTPAFDGQVLKLVSRKDLPPEPSPVPRYGDFGKIVFEFRAISPGETDLVIRIARKWEMKPRPEEYFRARIRVQE
jgi:predicted secreted protein